MFLQVAAFGGRPGHVQPLHGIPAFDVGMPLLPLVPVKGKLGPDTCIGAALQRPRWQTMFTCGWQTCQ